jgi:hypothetical protein
VHPEENAVDQRPSSSRVVAVLVPVRHCEHFERRVERVPTLRVRVDVDEAAPMWSVSFVPRLMTSTVGATLASAYTKWASASVSEPETALTVTAYAVVFGARYDIPK